MTAQDHYPSFCHYDIRLLSIFLPSWHKGSHPYFLSSWHKVLTHAFCHHGTKLLSMTLCHRGTKALILTFCHHGTKLLSMTLCHRGTKVPSLTFCHYGTRLLNILCATMAQGLPSSLSATVAQDFHIPFLPPWHKETTIFSTHSHLPSRSPKGYTRSFLSPPSYNSPENNPEFSLPKS